MNQIAKKILQSTGLCTALALTALMLLGTGMAGAQVAQYLDDGAIPNAEGGWDLPAQGTCPADLTKTTRPECLALRFPAFTTSTACNDGTPGGPSGTTASRAWSTGVCNDLIHTNATDCTNAGDRLWINGVCAVILSGDDRNNVACAIHQATWVTAGACIGNWVMPARTAYDPALLTRWAATGQGSAPNYSGPSAGDQCLRCHNSVTQYNGPRLRDVEWFLRHGHKNMARKVSPPDPWAGPGYECSVLPLVYLNREDCEDHAGVWERSLIIYPSDDSGNPFDWANGTINVDLVSVYTTQSTCEAALGVWSAGPPASCLVDNNLLWIYGDWLGPLPRAVYERPAGANTCTLPLAGACDLPSYLTEVTCVANSGIWTKNSTSAGCVANGGSWVAGAGISYSCARCHTTGWTSDATVNIATDITGKEPELSFPGVTWNRLGAAGPDHVSTAGAVAGDPNKSSSWDAFGITCSRCHGSAVSTTLGGTDVDGPYYNAPTGMSSHHNDLTGPGVGTGATNGYCTQPDFTAQTQCVAANGDWLTACSVAGKCSNLTYTRQRDCQDNSGTWTTSNSPGACTTNGGIWNTASSCSLAGICNTLNPAHNTQALCEASPHFGQWAAATDIIRCVDIHVYGRENGIPAYAAATWTGNKPQRGQIITALCVNCHRQETAGYPYGPVVTADTDRPAQNLKVGPAHGTVDFVSHPHGNQFLNSPHAKFTGTFAQIATGKFNGYLPGEYNSYFMQDGEAAGTGNGCTGCHDVHKSVVEEAFEPAPEQEGAIREECTECHAKNLNLVQHPAGKGTPLEEMNDEPFETCVSCHMPGGKHLFRINTEETYSTLPMPSALTTTVNANTALDGSYASAVWVDVDAACGQCHGGGTAQKTTTGSTVANSDTVTVVSSVGFVAGQRVKIVDAGALGYDDQGLGRGDFETYVISTPTATTIKLAGKPTLSVSGKAVIQNPTMNNAGYMSKSRLAVLAKGMHNDKPIATFSNTLGNPNTKKVYFNASGSSCSGDIANCDAFDWNFGGAGHLDLLDPVNTDITPVYIYDAGGTYTVTLTVEQYSVGSATKTRSIKVYTPDLPPTAMSSCNWNANTWALQVTELTTDPDLRQTTVNWGDGSVITSDTTVPFGPTYSHTYLLPGSFPIVHKAIDTIGQQSTDNPCTVAPAYFTIGGTVTAMPGALPVNTARVQVKQGALVVKTVYTNAAGVFLAGSLKPGSYTLVVTKLGYTFPASFGPITVGPASAGNAIVGTKP